MGGKASLREIFHVWSSMGHVQLESGMGWGPGGHGPNFGAHSLPPSSLSLPLSLTMADTRYGSGFLLTYQPVVHRTYLDVSPNVCTYMYEMEVGRPGSNALASVKAGEKKAPEPSRQRT